MSELNDSRTSSVAAMSAESYPIGRATRPPVPVGMGGAGGRGRLASARMQRPRRAAAATAAAAGIAVAVIAWRALWQEPRSGRVRERTLALERWPAALD